MIWSNLRLNRSNQLYPGNTKVLHKMRSTRLLTVLLVHLLLCTTAHIKCIDPLYSIRRPSKTSSPLDSSSIPQPDGSVYARSMREQSIKTNRRHKFVEALSKEDIDIGTVHLGETSHNKDSLYTQLKSENYLGTAYQMIFVLSHGRFCWFDLFVTASRFQLQPSF